MNIDLFNKILFHVSSGLGTGIRIEGNELVFSTSSPETMSAIQSLVNKDIAFKVEGGVVKIPFNEDTVVDILNTIFYDCNTDKVL